jgi:glyoxylase-like metal-dependent hydrolase (beta-lactamase superfamily II)
MDERLIGDVRVTRLPEMVLVERAADLFPNFDAEAARAHEPWLAPHHYDPAAGTITMPVSSWLLRAGGWTILIDTCCGNHKDRLGIPGMHQLQTPFLERLAAAGVAPETVDFVLCTHLHLDHVGWNTQLIGGRWVPTFPNARYVVSRTELEHAASAPGRLERLVYQDSIAPVVAAGLVETVDGEHGLLDLLTLRPAPGHSPGHVWIELASAGALGVFCGDIVHSPIQAPFWRWSTRYCEDPVQATATRRRLLDVCAETGALLLPAHFNHKPVARVRADGDVFALAFPAD